MVQAGKRLRTGIATPAEGMAELFVRLAADAGRDHTSPAGLVIARLATFLAPQNAETWLVTAGLLADDDKPHTALQAVAGISGWAGRCGGEGWDREGKSRWEPRQLTQKNKRKE